MTGLIVPDSGTVFLNRADITQVPMYLRARLGIRYLPQEASIFRGLTVENNILAVVELVEKNSDVRHEILEKLLDEFGLRHLRNTKATSLSGGERRRVEIARSLVGDPDFILMDEPCAALDPLATLKIEELINELKKKFTIVIVTHNMSQATRCSDRTAFMYLGKLIEYGDTIQIFENPKDSQTEAYITGVFG
jgi:lipopolysaccharide export system ATP-binding protein